MKINIFQILDSVSVTSFKLSIPSGSLLDGLYKPNNWILGVNAMPSLGGAKAAAIRRQVHRSHIDIDMVLLSGDLVSSEGPAQRSGFCGRPRRCLVNTIAAS